MKRLNPQVPIGIILLLFFASPVFLFQARSAPTDAHHDAHALLQNARELLENGQFKQALTSAENARQSAMGESQKTMEMEALFVQAKIRGQQGYLLDSLRMLEKVLAWYHLQDRLATEIEVYAELIRYSTDVDLKAAESYLEKAKALAEQLKNKDQYTLATAQLARASLFPLSAERNLEEVCLQAQAAASLYGELGRPKDAADALLAGGPAFFYLRQYDVYLKILKQAEDLYRQVDYFPGVEMVNVARGMYSWMQGDPETAKTVFQNVLVFHEKNKNKARTIRIYSLLGNLYYGTGDYEKSEMLWRKGLVLAEEIGAIADEISLKISLAEFQGPAAEEKSALLLMELANMARESGNRAIEADVLYSLGDLLIQEEQYQKGLASLQQALKVAESGQRRHKISLIQTSLITLYTRIGEYEKALSVSDRYVKELQKSASPWLFPNALALRAGLYERLKQYDQALVDYQAGVTLATENGDLVTAAQLMAGSANIYAQQGRYGQAVDLLLDAEQILSARGGNEEVLATVYMRMGDILLQFEKYEEAIICYTETLALFEQTGKQSKIADMAYLVGSSYQLGGRLSTALRFYPRAISYYEQNNLWAEAGKTWDALSTAYGSLGRAEDSFRALERGIDAFERARETAGLTEFKTSLQAKFSSLYDSMIYECLSRQEVEKGFSYLERQKSRSLLDMLGNEKIVPKKETDQALAEEGRVLLARIGRLQKENNSNEVNQAYRDYEMFQHRIRVEDPAYTSLVAVNPLPLTKIQQFLGPDSALVEYHSAGHPSAGLGTGEGIWNLNIFIVTRDDIRAVRLIGLADLQEQSLVSKGRVDTLYVPQRQLDALAGQIQELSEIVKGQNPWLSKRMPAILRSLSTTLIAPITPYLTNKTHLSIIPHGLLHHVPFAALQTAEGYLVQQYRLSFAPSASVIGFSLDNEKKSGQDTVILADDLSLPFVGLEVESIKRLYPDSLILTGEDVTRENIRQLDGKFRFIHFAMHGVFLSQSPLLSYLQLGAKEEHLEVREIFNLNLPSSLVTLSGCETGVVSLSSGEDMVGLSNSFLYAGAASLVVSLWKVDDRSTARFMDVFYQNLRHYEKAEALQRTQLQFINDKTVDKPCYWAPFILIGGWK
ncbi:MAG: CHAT domain-containing protein [Proteobacteria bacterium]|nr:CHAT domain-containing protein [Pseudomonadota bacterium]MBU1058272.1 CHAT domain-containing protein [Pseudomonadota bacterium]